MIDSSSLGISLLYGQQASESLDISNLKLHFSQKNQTREINRPILLGLGV
jgi:hypothetical protein